MSDDIPAAHVDNVETVNVTAPVNDGHLPYVWIVGGVTAVILIGFSCITWAVLDAARGSGIDAATKGAILRRGTTSP